MITTKGKTFTIQRSKWLRGEGSRASRLLRPCDGKLCCLGQVSQQLGFSDERISDKYALWDVEQGAPIEGLTEHCERVGDFRSTDAAEEMMLVNDCDEDQEQESRESRLCELAQQAGFSLQFVD